MTQELKMTEYCGYTGYVAAQYSHVLEASA